MAITKESFVSKSCKRCGVTRHFTKLEAKRINSPYICKSCVLSNGFNSKSLQQEKRKEG